MEAPKEMEAPIKAGYMEELRFAKRQQWYVAAAAVELTYYEEAIPCPKP